MTIWILTPLGCFLFALHPYQQQQKNEKTLKVRKIIILLKIHSHLTAITTKH